MGVDGDGVEGEKRARPQAEWCMGWHAKRAWMFTCRCPAIEYEVKIRLKSHNISHLRVAP